MRSIGSSGVSFTRCTPILLGYVGMASRGMGGTGVAPTPFSTGVGGTEMGILCLVASALVDLGTLILQGLLRNAK